MPNPFNHNFNHVAISVPDAKKATDFYSKVLGLRVVSIMTPEEMKKADPDGSMKLIYGPELSAASITILVSGNGVGFEIFQFDDPPYEGPVDRPAYSYKDYVKGGFFHICFTVPDPEATYQIAEKLGAKKIGITTMPARDEHVLYMQDPWGNIVELLSCSFEEVFLRRFADI